MSKKRAGDEGYQRGLQGKNGAASWGQTAADSLFNEAGSTQSRRKGYKAGLEQRKKSKGK